MKKYPRSIQCASFRNRIEDDLDVVIGELKHTLDDIAMQSSSYTDDGVDLLTEHIIKFNKSLKLDMKLMNDGFTITSASEPDATYQNKRNPNKFIETKKYNDGHRVARQYMKWDTPEGEVKNYTGAKDAKRGRYFRTRKDTLDQMLEDYDEVESATVISSNYGDRELVDTVPADTATGMYINIAETYPEYYENDGVAAHVFFDNGTANFWQDSKGTWRLGIMDETHYDDDNYRYLGKYWCTDELMPGDMNDIILTPQQLYAELKKLPGVDLNHLYGLREIFNDFDVEFSPWV